MWNPKVFTAEEEADSISENTISEEKLRELTGCNDLRQVDKLELKVDSRKTGLGQLGKLLPGLNQLKLNSSFVPSIRDLGSSYRMLTILWMARCELTDLDGIGSITTIKELYLANNAIQNLEDISLLDDLEILDLEGNQISQFDQLEYLSLCPNLSQLTLEGNPLNFGLSSDPSADERFQEKARCKILSLLPRLEILDDEPVRKSVEARIAKSNERPSTSYGRQKKIDVSQVLLQRPSTSHGRQSVYTADIVISDTSSSLTHGANRVLGGNPIHLLRARKQSQDKSIAVILQSNQPLYTRSHEPDILVIESSSESGDTLKANAKDVHATLAKNDQDAQKSHNPQPPSYPKPEASQSFNRPFSVPVPPKDSKMILLRPPRRRANRMTVTTAKDSQVAITRHVRTLPTPIT